MPIRSSRRLLGAYIHKMPDIPVAYNVTPMVSEYPTATPTRMAPMATAVPCETDAEYAARLQAEEALYCGVSESEKTKMREWSATCADAEATK